MPHGESWFSLLPFHQRFLAFAHNFGKPFREDGLTWYAHEDPGVQHIYAALFVLGLLAIVSVITETSIRDSKSDLVPPAKLTIRNFVEILVGATFNMMRDIMGDKAARYFLPLIGTCAFFILFSNALGLVPGFLPPTSNFNTTLACGIVIFITTHLYGLKVNGFNHIKHFFGPMIGLPWIPLMLLMFFIEMISHIARPISLGIRLMANMTADHMVLTIFLGLVPFLIPLPMYVLGTVVVIVQALVFSLLSTVYIGMAIEEAEHH
ncbi:MAG TPA: F0F1 ATP synthase subunit A [Polyangiales bacterium]|jgi:F-type H+-transporting ATPase subunit a|nr:F0F1 ATP synthase subunit A [Polyangiales bacterium]